MTLSARSHPKLSKHGVSFGSGNPVLMSSNRARYTSVDKSILGEYREWKYVPRDPLDGFPTIRSATPRVGRIRVSVPKTAAWQPNRLAKRRDFKNCKTSFGVDRHLLREEQSSCSKSAQWGEVSYGTCGISFSLRVRVLIYV